MPDPGDPRRRLVRASAGTGKTYALTTRYLALLRAGADPASILATTFTRKAAGEIAERVLTRLANAVLIPDDRVQLDRALRDEGLLNRDVAELDQATCEAMLNRLVERLDRTAIGTIDGFFARLCGAFAFELGLPLDPTLTDDGSALAAELREAAIDAMLGQAADEGFTALLTLLRQLHHDSAKRSVTASLDTIFRGDADGSYATFRQARDGDTWAQIDCPDTLSDEMIEQITQRLGDAETLLPKTQTGRPNANWGKAWANLLGQLHASQWESMLAGGLTKAALADGTYHRIAMHPQLHTLCERLGRHAASKLIQLLNLQHRSAWQLLDRFAHHFEDRCRAQRVMLFADLTDHLARHLRLHDLDGSSNDPETHATAVAWRDELAYRLDGRVEHLLIDEFQDTSIDQFAVLWPLIDEATADASSNRTLFVVGDAKQSIYGWRGGRVELFDTLEARTQPRGLQLCRLDRSFRSSDAVLHAVNAVFGSLPLSQAWSRHADAKQRFADDFEPHLAAYPQVSGEFRLLTTAADNDTTRPAEDDGSSPADRHTEASAQHLAGLAQRWPLASFGVLVRTNAQANALLRACRQQGLAASGETGAALTDHPAVNVVLSAMQLADHPGHRVAAYHVAHSPLGTLLKLEPGNARSAQRVSAHIRRALAARGYAAVVSHWATRLAPACDAAALRRLRQLVEVAEPYRPVSMLRPGSFVRFITSARVEDPSADRIRIMTVHRAKGLEFDAVILPFLHQERPFRAVLLEERDGDTGPITAVYRSGKRELRERIPELQDLFDRAESRNAYEQLCTLYVAMTRARHATHVLMPPAAKRNPREGDAMLALLLHALVDESEDLTGDHTELYSYQHRGGADAALAGRPDPGLPSESAATAGPRAWPVLRGGDTHPASATPPPAPSSSPGAGDHSRLSDVERILRSRQPHDAVAASFGERVHHALQCLGFSDEIPPITSETRDAAVDAYLREALAHDEVALALSRRGASEMRTEVPLIWQDQQGRVVRGIIDRLVWWNDADGRPQRAEVIDVKTDRPPDMDASAAATSLDEWLATRREHHTAQLQHYRSAAAAWLKISPSSMQSRLIFTSVGRVVSIPALGG